MANPRWGASRDRYLISLQADGCSPYTIRAKLSALGRLKAFCDERHVDPFEATPLLMAEWAWHLAALYSRSTIHDYCAIVRTFFRWAAAHDFPGTPFADLHVPSSPSVPVRPFSQSELRRLLKTAETVRQQAIVLMLLGTGVRANELVNLAVSDVDTATGIVTVRFGKGNKQREVCPGEYALATLRRYLADAHIRRGYLFPGRDTGHLRADSLTHIIRKLGRRAGVEDAHPHRFRNTFACRFMEASGGDVSALKQILGHNNVRMTLRYAEWAEQRRALDQQRRHNPADRLLLTTPRDGGIRSSG